MYLAISEINKKYYHILGVQALNKFGNEYLQKKYLYSLIKGEMVSAFAIIEHELSDLKNMATTAVLSTDKKHWVSLSAD